MAGSFDRDVPAVRDRGRQDFCLRGVALVAGTGHGEERLREIAIRKMEEGDPAFWRLLLDRVWPARHEIETTGERKISIRWLPTQPRPEPQGDAEADRE